MTIAKRSPIAIVLSFLYAFCLAIEASAQPTATAKQLSKVQNLSMNQTKYAVDHLCAIVPKTGRPRFCDRKDENLRALEAVIAADERAGSRISTLLADAASLAGCLNQVKADKSTCEALKRNGVPAQLREQASSIVPQHLGKANPTEYDKTMRRIATDLLQWNRLIENAPPGGASTSGPSVD